MKKITFIISMLMCSSSLATNIDWSVCESYLGFLYAKSSKGHVYLDQKKLKKGIIRPPKNVKGLKYYKENSSGVRFRVANPQNKDAEYLFEVKGRNRASKLTVTRYNLIKENVLRTISSLDVESGRCIISEEVESVLSRGGRELVKKDYSFNKCSSFLGQVSKGISSKDLYRKYYFSDRIKLASLVEESKRKQKVIATNTGLLSKKLTKLKAKLCPNSPHLFNLGLVVELVSPGSEENI